jgi:hypothetical protein
MDIFRGKFISLLWDLILLEFAVVKKQVKIKIKKLQK